MKNLLILITIMLVGGCNKTPTLEESVVGEYEHKFDTLAKEEGRTASVKYVFLENGIVEIYRSGKKQREDKWSIVDGELHIEGFGDVFRINEDKSITGITYIVDGEREYLPKELQTTLKKIK